MSYDDWVRYPVTSNRYKLGSAGYLFGKGNDITKLVKKLPNRNISKSDMPSIGSKGTDNMIGAIISGVVGLASAIGSIFSSRSASKRASKEAELQRQWQERMYNQSNQYNDPSQQLARYKQAGLNPNLVFGQGASSLAAQFGSGASASGNVSTTPQYGDALKGISDAIMLYNQYKQTQSNIALQDEQIKTQRTQQKLNEAEANKKGSEKTGIDWQNDFNKSNEQILSAGLAARNRLDTTAADLNEQNRSNLKLMRGEIISRTASYQADADLKDSEIWYNWHTMERRYAKLDADIQVAIADAWYTRILGKVANKKLPYEVNKLIFEAYESMQRGKLLDFELDSNLTPEEIRKAKRLAQDVENNNNEFEIEMQEFSKHYDWIPFLRLLSWRALKDVLNSISFGISKKL